MVNRRKMIRKPLAFDPNRGQGLTLVDTCQPDWTKVNPEEYKLIGTSERPGLVERNINGDGGIRTREPNGSDP